MNSGKVLAALKKRWPEERGAHAWLYEVRNHVGFSGPERYADALVVSCWPSRGIWCAGVEVKVSRSDWRRELEDEGKAAAIMKWCDRWWVAAPAKVFELSEVPETWGAIVVEGAGDKLKSRVVKEAPKLEPEPWSRAFAASVLRTAASSQAGVRKIAFDEGYQVARNAASETKIDELKNKIVELERAARSAVYKISDLQQSNEILRKNVANFEEASGIKLGLEWNYRETGKATTFGAAFKAACGMSELDLSKLEARLRSIADDIAAVGKVE